MRMLAALVVLVGCASANVNAGGGDDEPPIDAPDDPPTDAPDVPVTVTLSQTTSTTIAAGNTLACPDANTGGTVENTFYRVFPLASSGITNAFEVTSVSFGVESAATIGGGGQTVTIKVGTYAGTIAPDTTSLTIAQFTQLGTATANVPDGDGATITTPVTATIPANSNLWVEILSPSAGTLFFPGSNNGGESFPGFIRAPECGTTEPGNYSTTVGQPVHLLLTVTGTH